ncbi:MAG: TRAP transporter substrate-binding protein [Thermodesulfobacteriota bacterium]
MKKSFVFLGVALVAALALCVAWQGSAYAEDKKIEMSFSSIYMNKHNTVVSGWKPWIKEIEEKTGGRVKLNYYDPGTLSPDREVWSSVLSGAVDLGTAFCPVNPGKFPLTEVMELPLIAPGAEAGSLVTWDLCQKYPEWRELFKDVKLLWMWTSATYQIHTKNKLIRTLEDLKGMRIIGWNPGILETIRLLGGNPIEIGYLDTYLAMERGMADGVCCPLAPIRSLKISDAAKYTTVIDMMVGPFWGAMNIKLWNSLPKDIQNVFLETTGEKMVRITGQTLDQGAAQDAKWLKDTKGHKFYVVPDQEKKRWLQVISPMHEAWVNKMDKQGYKNAKAILEDAILLGEKYAKVTGRGYQE